MQLTSDQLTESRPVHPLDLSSLRAAVQALANAVDVVSSPEMVGLRCKSALADALDLNVDLIVQQPGRDLPIYRIARQSGAAL